MGQLRARISHRDVELSEGESEKWRAIEGQPKSVTPITPLRALSGTGVVFSVVYMARMQRRRRICALFSKYTESSKLRVAGSIPAAPTIVFNSLLGF